MSLGPSMSSGPSQNLGDEIAVNYRVCDPCLIIFLMLNSAL